MADQDEMMGLVLSNLARLAARLSVVAGDVRAVRGLLEQRAERTEFAEIVERLKQSGVIPEEFDAAALEGEESKRSEVRGNKLDDGAAVGSSCFEEVGP